MTDQKTQVNWLGGLASTASIIASLATAGALVFAAITVQQSNKTFQYSALSRVQDAEYQHLLSLESQLYAFEKGDPKLICLYKEYADDALGCTDAYRKLNATTIPYAEMVVDFEVLAKEYQSNWCVEDPGELPVLQSCNIYDDFLAEIDADPYGVFAGVRKATGKGSHSAASVMSDAESSPESEAASS